LSALYFPRRQRDRAVRGGAIHGHRRRDRLRLDVLLAVVPQEDRDGVPLPLRGIGRVDLVGEGALALRLHDGAAVEPLEPAARGLALAHGDGGEEVAAHRGALALRVQLARGRLLVLWFELQDVVELRDRVAVALGGHGLLGLGHEPGYGVDGRGRRRWRRPRGGGGGHDGRRRVGRGRGGGRPRRGQRRLRGRGARRRKDRTRGLGPRRGHDGHVFL